MSAAPGNVFTGYGLGYVEINQQRFERNLLVTPESIEGDWLPGGFGALSREAFSALLRFEPEIVLLGTGSAIRFPHPRLIIDLSARRVGLEVMDVSAACRTFNVLSAEGRRVIAALLLEPRA